MKIKSIIKQIKQGELPSFSYMFKRIWNYACDYSARYNIPRVYLFVDYFICALIYGCSGEDYFICRFFRMSRREKKSFVSEAYETAFEKRHTDAEQKSLVDDKEKALEYFGKYVNRDWCGPTNNNSEKCFAAFYEKHTDGILKPVGGHGGQNVEVINLSEKFKSPEEMRICCINNKMVVEELIEQHEDLSRVYPNAINTIRMITLKGKLIGAALRMGVGESNVDNAHAGGIYAEVDISEGVTVGNAMNHMSDEYTAHPTTGTEISGIRIPYWNECKLMVEEASRLVADVYLIGWDVAVTPAGPTLVEANTGPGLRLIQAPNGHGLKHEFEKVKD